MTFQTPPFSFSKVSDLLLSIHPFILLLPLVVVSHGLPLLPDRHQHAGEVEGLPVHYV